MHVRFDDIIIYHCKQSKCVSVVEEIKVMVDFNGKAKDGKTDMEICMH